MTMRLLLCLTLPLAVQSACTPSRPQQGDAADTRNVAAPARDGTSTASWPTHARSGLLLIANQQGSSASIVDLATGQVTALDVGPGPHEAVISPDGRWGVVTLYATGVGGNQLALIDMRARAISRIIDVPGYNRLHDITFLPGSSTRVAVTSEATKKVVVVDLVAGTVTADVETLGIVSHMLALADDGRTLFTANMGGMNVSQMDLATRTFVRQIRVGPRPEGIAITPDGREVWVGSNEAGTVSIVSPDSGKVIATIGDLGFPYRIDISPGGTRAIIPDPPRNRVHVLDVAARRTLGTIDLPGSPRGVTIAPDDRTAFVTLGPEAAVLVVDLEERTVLARHAVGEVPDGVGWGPAPSP